MTSFGAVLVTRGDVDLVPIIESIYEAGVKQVVVWDNSRRPHDLAVYGRYAAIAELDSSEQVFVQDDDCAVPVERILDAYEPGRLVANMPAGRWPDYPDSALVGWGAVFDRDLPTMALGRFVAALGFDQVLDAYERDPGFIHRTCDVVFSALTPRTVVDFGFVHREFAEDASRMFRQPGHKAERDRMLDLCRRVRGDAPDDDVRAETR